MSKQTHSRRLNPIAAANAERNKALWRDPKTYGVLVVGAMLGVGIPAIANTNPFNPEADTPFLGSTTTGTPNPATTGGLGSATGSSKDEGNGGSTGGSVAGDGGGAVGAGGVIDTDVVKAAVTCADPANPDGIKATHTKVLKERTELAVIQVDIDKMFNLDPKDPANAAAAGCFSAANQIIDLSIGIPSIPTSWGDIGGLVRKQIDKHIANAQKQFLERGCEIANSALSSALGPINTFLTGVNGSSLINSPEGFVGGYISKQIDGAFDEADLIFNGVLDKVDNSIKEQNQNAQDKANAVAGQLEDLDRVGDYDMKDFNDRVENINKDITAGSVQSAQADLNRLISEAPPATSTYRRDKTTYYCKTVNSNCVDITRREYDRINEAAQVHALQMQAARARLAAAQATAANQPVPQSAPTPSTYGQGFGANTPAPQPRQAPAQAPTVNTTTAPKPSSAPASSSSTAPFSPSGSTGSSTGTAGKANPFG